VTGSGSTMRRLATSLVGAIAGAVLFGLLAPLAHRITNPGTDFGYEFEGFGLLLVLGAVGLVLGAVAGNALGQRVGGKVERPEALRHPGHPTLVRSLWEGGLLAFGALAGFGLAIVGGIVWQVDLGPIAWAVVTIGALAGFLGGRALADRSPASLGRG
jgi:hypothetical protein